MKYGLFWRMKRCNFSKVRRVYSYFLRNLLGNMIQSEDETIFSQDDRSVSSNGRAFCNVMLLGLAFSVIFTAFNTCANMSQVVIDSIHNADPSFTGSGYVSLAVLYIVFAAANWIVPSVLSVFGPKLTMVLGGTTYVIFMASFLWPQTWLLYSASVLVGVGAALVWTAQGNYLTLMSDKITIARNSGVFWALLQCSFLFGNLFVFYEFRGQEVISSDTRITVFSSLTVIGAFGVCLLCLLAKPGASTGRDENEEIGSPSDELRKSLNLFKTKEMLLLSVTFFYTGIALSFFSGVYSACISFTLRFNDAKRLVGLSGIFIGCGEILGGAIFGIFGKKTIKFGRDPIVFLGYLLHMGCFYLIFVNLPAASPLGNTNDPSYLPSGRPSEFLAMLCSFLLGLGDACYNTQIFSLLGSVYSENSGPAFALFKFTQSLAAAACFFYASALSLTWHLIILVILGTAGTLTFCNVEWNQHRRSKSAVNSI